MARKGTKQKRYVDLDGNIRWASGKTLSVATKNATNKQRDIREGKEVVSSKMTVKDWSIEFLTTYKHGVAISTYRGYKSKINKWINGSIGSMKLTDVRSLHCQKILNSMSGMATDTISKVNQLMSLMFREAKINHLVGINPAEYLHLPKGTKTTHRKITEDERDLILRVADSDPDYIYFLIMLYCGCRPIESAGVQKFDFIQISGANMLHIRGNKSKNADRIVPVPEYISARIPEKDPFQYLVGNKNGTMLTDTQRQALWVRFKESLNADLNKNNDSEMSVSIAPDLKPYCLRHTYCTDLQKAGVDIRTAQYLMGHSDITLTANIYTHTDEQDLVEVSKKIDKKIELKKSRAEE